jgi:hypothetical protein
MKKTSLVVTSISQPNSVLKTLAEGARQAAWDFYLAGDSKSPRDFKLDGCDFLSLEDQQKGVFESGRLCPIRSYARKNIAYLNAMSNGAEVMVETDDDNFPREAFWKNRATGADCHVVRHDGWVNVYGYFSDNFIYPRGFPLHHARDPIPPSAPAQRVDCLIQQGLADENPDVDAVYRMLFPLPFTFGKQRAGHAIALAGGAWCPFNSQNTTFHKPVFPLLYLPAHCSFRMTDIWRSFVALRIMHEIGGAVMFHESTVWQERNEHDLHRDFLDEIPGYMHNAPIRDALVATSLSDVRHSIPIMMERCYQTLMREKWVGAGEETLLRTWLTDLGHIEMRPHASGVTKQ